MDIKIMDIIGIMLNISQVALRAGFAKILLLLLQLVAIKN
jgi:hypothetical protein